MAELHRKGLSIMEIANKLGIGVGEAKVMIDQINEVKLQRIQMRLAGSKAVGR